MTGARLGANQEGSPLAKEEAGEGAASTGVFNQKKLNAYLSAEGSLGVVHANIRSQDQLGARRLQRRAADLATKAGGITTGVSSQIHIHDHILSKSQGKGPAHAAETLWRASAAAGTGKQRRGLGRARKLLASQGRSGATRPLQKWPAGLAAVKTDERPLHGGQEHASSYFRGDNEARMAGEGVNYIS